VVCIMLGTITACFGGVIRDISLNNIPLIFQKEIYATACIVGSIVFFALNEMEMSPTAIEVICIAVVVFIRLLAVKFNWRLPALKFTEQEK
ncbi:MAG: TRIC cation channel family protein, partial [Bacteroidia bacterium]|nr:TRIC cation channel family protein [Bacteroidia bacterium]